MAAVAALDLIVSTIPRALAKDCLGESHVPFAPNVVSGVPQRQSPLWES